MAKCYIGVSSKARNIKNIYIGVSGKARRVAKAYIGVGGKARVFWSGGSVYKWGTATALTAARYDFGAAHIGNYALFAAGMPASGANASGRAVGGQNSSYALFLASDSTTYSYDTSLTLKKRSTIKATPEGFAPSVSFNNYILFAGGYTSAVGNGICIFDSSLTYKQSGTISQIMLNAAGTSVGNYVIFAGGRSARTGGAYDSSITKLTMSGKSLSVARSSLAAATNGSYAIFTGGFDENIKTVNNADVYNMSMTKSTGTSLSTSRADHTGISIDTYALFIGGRPTTSTFTSAVDIYDSSLTKTTNSISTNRGDGAGTNIGNKIIFAGGQSRDSGSLATVNTVDVFAI